ncbi:hypothetical protein F511_03391 [Dorcoceras hygrometricum]|uniref:J domain-containing protein n=1 Tax=Dorcoceras hygrometricum TaxID=472368 RepID=A0A2Z7BG77_9LAMI|nr:hypothetical protein F511_03391 [Dorcoceras hygrometricum]
MGVGYYNILSGDRNAQEDYLEKAYRKLAMKWHPDKNPNTKRMLRPNSSKSPKLPIDPQKRAVYDQHGEEGLKGQVPPPPGASGLSGDAGGPTTFRFNPRNADDLFPEFLGDNDFTCSGPPDYYCSIILMNNR